MMILTPWLFHSAVQLRDEEISTILRKYSKNLKIGHININSVAGFKFFEFKSLIVKSLFDIVVISECKVDHLFPDSHFYIKGFRLYCKDCKQEPIQRRFEFSDVLYFGWPNQPSSGTMRVYIELLLCTYIYITNCRQYFIYI